jgi:hypothetical protein
MLSSKDNIDTIADLISEIRHYIGLQTEYTKLGVVEKSTILLTVLIVGGVATLIGVVVLFFLSFAAVSYLSQFIGMTWSYALAALFHIILLVLVITYRKAWIERPLARFLAALFLRDDNEED